MIKIGIIGLGFVGNAVYSFYGDKNFNIIKYDIQREKSDFNTLNDFLNEKPEYIFLCVPTPEVNHKSNFGIIGDLLLEIEEYSIRNNHEFKIIIKSTVSPEFLKTLKTRINNSILITFPEFLSQKTAVEDFENSEILIFGCENQVVLDKTIFDLCVGFSKLTKVYKFYDIGTPMKFKYVHNVMGALSILMSNIMFDYINDEHIYSIFKEFLVKTNHFTDTYLNVPGHDGSRGFGGACFPKDLVSFIEQISVDENISTEEFEFIAKAKILNNKLRK